MNAQACETAERSGTAPVPQHGSPPPSKWKGTTRAYRRMDILVRRPVGGLASPSDLGALGNF